jgi:hypothetical protein
MRNVDSYTNRGPRLHLLPQFAPIAVFPQPMSGYAIEVARRQPDGTWRWLIGDPFTVSSSLLSNPRSTF